MFKAEEEGPSILKVLSKFVSIHNLDWGLRGVGWDRVSESWYRDS